MVDARTFASQAERACNSRLETFIHNGRNAPNPFSVFNDFELDSWDVTAAIRGTGRGRIRITFSTLETANTRVPELMQRDFREFAKAYLVRLQQINPVRAVQHRLPALRALEAALRHHEMRLTRFGGDVLDHAATLIAGHFSKASAYRFGAQLELISEFLAEEGLTVAPLQWKNPIRRPRDRTRVGPEHESKRAKRLPTSTALEAVTLAFRRASHPSDRLVAATAALLCSAPVRIGEVLRMRADCEVESRTAAGTDAYGLRWWTEKGVDPEIRWILPSMVPTVRTALAVVHEVTAEARRIAAWYEKHQDELYLPDRFGHVRQEGFIDLEAADQLLGLSAAWWGGRRGVKVRQGRGGRGFAFEELEAEVLKDLPSGFPTVETGTGLRASDALYVVQLNEFRTDRGTSLCMIEPVMQQQISTALGARAEHGFASMFSRLGLTNDDGSPIKIKTHAFRHWLNTLAQRGGVDPLDIAKWSGRKSVAQNAAYDHVSAEEFLEDLSEVTGGGSKAVPVQVQSLATREEFAADVSGAAHVTEFGFCLHDFAMLPCQLHRDCLNCDEHACVKGDLEKEGRLIAFLGDAKRLLALAEEAAELGYEGADRWKDHQRRTVARGEAIEAVLHDPDIPVGTLIRPGSQGLGAGMSRSLAKR